MKMCIRDSLSDDEVNQILPFSPCERKGDTMHLKSPAAETAPDALLIRIYEAIKENQRTFKKYMTNKDIYYAR